MCFFAFFFLFGNFVTANFLIALYFILLLLFLRYLFVFKCEQKVCEGEEKWEGILEELGEGKHILLKKNSIYF